jgi:hypothetical protein
MALMATWEITITRGDGSRLRFTEMRSAAPKMGEIVQIKDSGQPIKARIETVHEGRPIGGVRVPFFKVTATEIIM